MINKNYHLELRMQPPLSEVFRSMGSRARQGVTGLISATCCLGVMLRGRGDAPVLGLPGVSLHPQVTHRHQQQQDFSHPTTCAPLKMLVVWTNPPVAPSGEVMNNQARPREFGWDLNVPGYSRQEKQMNWVWIPAEDLKLGSFLHGVLEREDNWCAFMSHIYHSRTEESIANALHWRACMPVPGDTGSAIRCL